MYDEETNTTVPVEVNLDVENEQELEFFFDDKVRRVFHRQHEEWYFSVVDVVQVLTDSTDPKQYIKKLRSRDSELNSSWGTICTLTQMPAADGKFYRTTAAKIDGLFRIIQSIPSKKAEPFKLWLAQVGKERLDEYVDPSLSFDRMIQTYRAKGYSEEWIAQRLESIGVRKRLTDEWKRSDVHEEKEYAALTSAITKAWSGKTVKEYKKFKGLHKENLRDNMTDIEITLNQLAEISATMISKSSNPHGFRESMGIAVRGGTIAGNARAELEEQLGRSVISPLNATTPELLDEKKKNQ